MNRYVAGKAPELLPDEVRTDRLCIIDVIGVLNCQTGKYGQRVRAEGCDCLYVSLDSGSAGGVQPGEDKNMGASVMIDGVPPQKGLTTARMTTANRTNTGSSLNQR